MDFQENYLQNLRFEFRRYKTLGDKTIAQLNEKDIHWKYNESDNSIALIVKHLSGNMLSRWTNFLIEDGEKDWRNRESEFEHPPTSKKALLNVWEEGWDCLFTALDTVNPNNFNTRITIRNEEHTLIEAFNRQLAHYAYHVGQITLLGKLIKGDKWLSLSIPKGASKLFNKQK